MPRIFIPQHFWQANLAGWAIIALFNVASRTVFFGDFGDALARTLIFDSIGFCLTCLGHFLMRGRLRSRKSVIVMIPLALAFCVVGAGAQWAVAELLRHAAYTEAVFRNPAGGRYITLIYYTMIFFSWTLSYLWLSADRAFHSEQVQRSRAESMAARAELQQLRIQLDPHFLFNALNTVAAETHERPDVALEMIRRICDYMRYCLDHQLRSACPLADEIDAARAYLRIQELRYDGRLNCAVRLEPEAGDFPVPHLILQGLVENAVKHSLGPATDIPLRITVAARIEGEHLRIEVTNPGTYAPCAKPGSGLGLANIRRRLELHYPEEHHLSVAQEQDLVCVRITVRGPICFA
ncbi:histidine kinase [Aquabacter sp. CN5-332]|uniref:sensor histidine kinase n=1 Tax=Aquabacter sp. CN5-332 TaxID=3156608 RepID=UPI0032B60735